MIFVEYPVPDDDKTWETACQYDFWKHLRTFKLQSDSLRKTYPFDELALNRLIGKNYRDLTDSEVDTIILSFTFYVITQMPTSIPISRTKVRPGSLPTLTRMRTGI